MPLAFALALAAVASDARPVWHYVRSNSDGGEAESVVVFAESRHRVAVFKGRARCTDAAYVTADLDKNGQVTRLVGGRLSRDLTQRAQAWLVHNRKRGRLEVRTGQADAAPVFDVAVAKRWVLYDFDFADLIARPPRALARRRGAAFDFPLLLVGEDGAKMNNLGHAQLRFVTEEMRGGVPAYRYRLSGPALKGASGDIWFARTGLHIVEAALPIPNHAEYRDFRLKLTRTGTGEADWKARLGEHWQGCRP